MFYRSFARVPDRPEPTIRKDLPCKDMSPASAAATTRSSTKDSTPSPARRRRSWHPAGTDRAEAEALAARLAAERDGRNDEIRSLTFGAYLTGQWLPAKKLTLSDSAYRGYVHKTRRHILPALGRKRLRRLRPQDLEQLYTSMLHPTDGARPVWHPRPSTKFTSSSAVPSPTRSARGLVDPQRRARRSRAQACGRSPRSSRRPGPPPSSRRSSEPPPATACSLPCGYPP